MKPTNGLTLRHRLLVATPSLGDPNFERTVVLILEHSATEGALGVVLNRPTETELDGPLASWRSMAVPPVVVFGGGPVNPMAAICLASIWPDEKVEGYERVFGQVGTIDLERDADTYASAVQGLRVFAGYAGWTENQLEAEIDAGAWFVVDARAEDAFHPDPEALWQAVLRRQRGTLAMFANYPPNPAVN